jgi:hypothetical protein
MAENRKPLELIKSGGNPQTIGDTPTPKSIRVRRLKSIEDASKLVARITTELQKGSVSIERAKAIGFLAQVFISSVRQSAEEKTFDEILKTKFMLIQKEAVRILDRITKKIYEKTGLDESAFGNILTEAKNSLQDEREWKKLVKEVKDEISTQTNFKMKILSEENPEEIKKLIAFRLRQLPENDRMNFINEIITENGWNKNE